MPSKTLLGKIDQMDLTRTITNNHKRLYEVNESSSTKTIRHTPTVRNVQKQYSSESSDEDQQILDKFYNAREDTCNSIITIESNSTCILPMY